MPITLYKLEQQQKAKTTIATCYIYNEEEWKEADWRVREREREKTQAYKQQHTRITNTSTHTG